MATREVYTLITNDYNIKFSKIGTAVKVSMPGLGCQLNHDSHMNFSEEFVTELEEDGWSAEAIEKMRLYILSEETWSRCKNINIQSGEIK